MPRFPICPGVILIIVQSSWKPFQPKLSDLVDPSAFQSFWLSDLSFPKVVSKAWSHNRSLVDSIDTFTKDVALWNKNSYGNIHAKKKRVLARLYGAQRALSNRPSAPFIKLEKSLHLELETLLDQERDLWTLKSRINWMIQGDRNTSFYHISALARRKRNHIASVKNSAGDWLTEERDVMEYFRTRFISLYTTSHSKADWGTKKISSWQIQLSEEDKCSLAEMVSPAEIKEALWSMKAYKAPGPDGLYAGFFQRFWLVVGDSVKEEVMKVFRERKVPEYLNHTLIVLIPKIQGPETIGNYRPISLRNSVYKIITKVIVARIRPHLDSLISPL